MEVKINKEIRSYTESMFFGLSLRQCFFAALAIGVAVIIYFSMKDALGLETVSWLCIMGALPFGAAGFVTYNGMSAEQFLWAFIKSELIMPRKLMFRAENLYDLLMQQKPQARSLMTEPPERPQRGLFFRRDNKNGKGTYFRNQ